MARRGRAFVILSGLVHKEEGVRGPANLAGEACDCGRGASPSTQRGKAAGALNRLDPSSSSDFVASQVLTCICYVLPVY